MGAHARVMPSKLALTVPCPGSLQLQERGVPAPMTREQAEGELAHTVARKYAQGFANEWPVGRRVTAGEHEFEIDEDMVDGAYLYAEEAQRNGRFEQPLTIPDLPECFGTPDWWRVLDEPGIRQLKVVEYKYGHRYVEAFQLYQAIAYAMGVVRFLNLPMDFPVCITVVQPRCYSAPPVREWKTTVEEIYQIVSQVIAPRTTWALTADPPTYTGKHCLDCAARHQCRSLAIENASIVDFSGTAETQDLSHEAIGQELRILKEAMKRLEARYTGLYEHASALARNGKTISHWHMEAGNGRLQWLEGVNKQQIAAMGDLMGVNVRKPMALLTPTQAKSAGIDEAVLKSYAHRPRGPMRLVPDDTTRTRKIFGDNR